MPLVPARMEAVMSSHRRAARDRRRRAAAATAMALLFLSLRGVVRAASGGRSPSARRGSAGERRNFDHIGNISSALHDINDLIPKARPHRHLKRVIDRRGNPLERNARLMSHPEEKGAPASRKRQMYLTCFGIVFVW